MLQKKGNSMKDYSRTELENGINEWIVGRNAERNRYILKLKLIDGLSYLAIANKLNQESMPDSYKIDVRQIQRIIRKSETILFRHI